MGPQAGAAAAGRVPDGARPGRGYCFAAVGDVHGHHHALVAQVERLAAVAAVTPAFVLQVGDFEPNRDDGDLASLAAPSRYRALGDFPDFAAGRAAFPWPLWFVGGNHEPYGFLDGLAPGAAVAPRAHFVGRAAVHDIGGLRVAGLSGIYHPERSHVPRPALGDLPRTSRKAYVVFTEQDEDALLAATEAAPVDVLLLHEWPAGLVAPGDEAAFEQQRRSLNEAAVGNERARMLVELLRPRLVLAGHMHVPYRRTLQHADGSAWAFCGLAAVAHGAGSVALFGVDDAGNIAEVTPAAERPAAGPAAD